MTKSSISPRQYVASKPVLVIFASISIIEADSGEEVVQEVATLERHSLRPENPLEGCGSR